MVLPVIVAIFQRNATSIRPRFSKLLPKVWSILKKANLATPNGYHMSSETDAGLADVAGFQMPAVFIVVRYK
jgi:hypothetical protein